MEGTSDLNFDHCSSAHDNTFTVRREILVISVVCIAGSLLEVQSFPK